MLGISLIVDSLADFVIQPAREQPADAEHIDRRAQGAVAQAVFALAKAARPMIDRNLHQPITRAFDERRNEAVHAFEWHERADAFAPHRFQRATGVAHAIPGEPAPHRICDPAGNAFHASCLCRCCAITANQIGATRDLRQQPRNVGRIVLQIAIDENDRRAARGLQAGVNRRALPGIFFEPNHAEHSAQIRFAPRSDRSIRHRQKSFRDRSRPRPRATPICKIDMFSSSLKSGTTTETAGALSFVHNGKRAIISAEKNLPGAKRLAVTLHFDRANRLGRFKCRRDVVGRTSRFALADKQRAPPNE